MKAVGWDTLCGVILQGGLLCKAARSCFGLHCLAANWMDSSNNSRISGGIFFLQTNNSLENSKISSAFLQAPTMVSGQKLLAGQTAGGLPLSVIPSQPGKGQGTQRVPQAQSPSCDPAQDSAVPCCSSVQGLWCTIHHQTPPCAAFPSASS